MQVIEITKGEDLRFTVPITDDNGNAVVLTNWQFSTRIRTPELQATAYAFVITNLNPPSNLIEYFMPRSMSATLLRRFYLVDTLVIQPNTDRTYPENLKFKLLVIS